MTVKQYKNHLFFIAAAAGLVTMAVYLPALRNSFVNWDDEWYVVDNPVIRSLDAALLKWAFCEFFLANWHPLTQLSHAVDYALWGLNPAGHHLTNIVLHGLNTFLVTLVVFRLLNGPSRVASTQGGATSFTPRMSALAALFTGLLFGLHPVHVESVAWLSERKDLLFTLFYLLSVLSYVQYAENTPAISGENGPRRHPKRRAYWASLFLFLLSLMSKPMAVTLPVVLLILDWYPLNRLAKGPRTATIREKLPFLALSLASSTLTLFAQRDALIPLAGTSVADRTMIGIHALIAYLGKMVWPADLNPFYPYPAYVSFLSWKYALPVILALGTTIAAVMLVKKRRIFLAVWSFYCITLLPVLGFVQVGNQSMADRYTYLPSVGPFLLAGLAGVLVFDKAARSGNMSKLFMRLFIAAVFLLYAALSTATVRQTAVWKDGVSLWDHVIKLISREDISAYHNVNIALNNRGNAFEKAGKIDRATGDYQLALTIKSDDAVTRYNIGNLLLLQDRIEEAIPQLLSAAELKDDLFEPHFSLGLAYFRLKRFAEAARELEKAATLKPSDARTRFELGNAYDAFGNNNKAQHEWEEAVKLRPDWPEAHYNLGNAYFDQGRTDDAVSAYLTALRYRPDYTEARINLGSTYIQRGKLNDAILEYEAAVRGKADSAEAHYNLGLAYTALGRHGDAAKEYGISRTLKIKREKINE